MATIYKELKDAKLQWYHIGLELGLSVADLDAIKREFNYNHDECLKETLKKFLEKGETKATWKLFVNVLKSVNNSALADQVQQNHV